MKTKTLKLGITFSSLVLASAFLAGCGGDLGEGGVHFGMDDPGLHNFLDLDSLAGGEMNFGDFDLSTVFKGVDFDQLAVEVQDVVDIFSGAFQFPST